MGAEMAPPRARAPTCEGWNKRPQAGETGGTVCPTTGLQRDTRGFGATPRPRQRVTHDFGPLSG